MACLLPLSAAADPQWEIAGGYGAALYRTKSDPALTTEETDSKELLPVGWFGSFAARTVEWLSVVVEASGEYATSRTNGVATKRQAFMFLDGVRVHRDVRSRATVFGELLVGVVHDRSFESDATSANRFAWRPAAGVDVAITERMSVRFHGGLRYVHGEPPKTDAYQFMTGVVFSSERR